MYKIYCDDLLICDSRIEELCVNSPIVQLEVNTSNWFTFSFPPTHPYINSIHHLTSIIRVERDDELLFQGFSSEESTDIFGNKTISCEGELAYLNDSILRPHKYQGESVESLFRKYIAEHNAQVEERKRFTVGRITVSDPNDYIYCYTNMNVTIDEIEMDLINDYGGYLFVRYENGVKYLDYLAEPEHEAQQIIELGRNLLDYNSNINSNVIVTRVIPLGELLETEVIEGLPTRLDIKSVNGGKDYLDSDQAIQNFGIITSTVTFDKVTTASELKRKGQQWLSENQFANVTIKLSAFDLSMISNEFQQLKLFDRVRVVSSYHGMDRRFMLSRMVLDLNNPERDLYSLGQDQYSNLTVQSVALSANLGRVVESAPQSESELLKKAENQTLSLLTSMGYTIFSIDRNNRLVELLVMDNMNKEIATDVLKWNENGLSYSHEGYTGTYTNIIDINGQINANFIKTGEITNIPINNGLNSFVLNQNGLLKINTEKTIERKPEDYSQADVTKLQGIISGIVIPTNADYEKLDLNNDGLLDSSDVSLVEDMLEPNAEPVEINCLLKINLEDEQATISTDNVKIGNNSIRTLNEVIDGTLSIEGEHVKVRDVNDIIGGGNIQYEGVSGSFTDINSITILNGIIVDITTTPQP